MAASGAKYGIATSRFYWISDSGHGVRRHFMMPFTPGSRARSVPGIYGYALTKKRAEWGTISFAIMTVFSSEFRCIQWPA
jgi:SSS family solute:Na+ symporter